MLLEFQIAAKKLGQILIAQIREREICVTDTFLFNGDTYVLDHAEILDGAFLKFAAGDLVVHTTGGNDQTVQGRIVQYVQPVQLDFTKQSSLEAADENPTQPDITPRIMLTFDLTMGVDHGVPTLHFHLSGVTAALLDVLVPGASSTVKAHLSSDVASNLDLSSLSDLLKTPVSATNAGVAIDDDGTRVSLRVEVNDAGGSLAEWSAFYTQAPRDLLGGNDWALLVDQALVVPLTRDRVAAGVGSKTFTVTSGPSGLWSWAAGPQVIVTLSGDAVDACSCLFIPIDVGVDVTITVTLSVPAEDVLRLDAKISFHEHAGAVFCCALSDALFWPIIGQELLAMGVLDGGSGWAEYLTGVALGPLGSFATFIGTIVSASNKDPDIQPPANFQKISDTEFQGDQPVVINPGLGLLQITGITALPDGPVLAGTLSVLSIPAPKLVVNSVDPFAWRNDGSCGTGFDLVNAAYIYLTGARELCAAQILDDADGCYQASLPLPSASPGLNSLPQVTITPDMDKVTALAHPYPCKVLILSDGGARIITIPPPVAITAQEQQTLTAQAEILHVTCNLAYDPFWRFAGEYSPDWIGDPGPEWAPDFDVAHLWQVLATGLRADEELIARDRAGAVIATAFAGPNGMAHVSATTARIADGHELSLSRREGTQVAELPTTAAHGVGTAARTATGRPEARKLLVKQILLHRDATIPLATPAQHLTAAAIHNRPMAIAIGSGGVRVFDLSTSCAPLAYQTVVARGVRGAAVWRDRLVVWGEHGVIALAPGESRAEIPPERCRRVPVTDAVRIGDHLAVLDRDGVSLLAADLSTAATLDTARATSLAPAGKRLLVTGHHGVEVFDVSRPLASRREAAHPRTWTVLEAAPSSAAAHAPVFARRETDGGALFDVSGGALLEVARYERDPWFRGAARIGHLFARLEADGHAIAIWRIVATRVL